MTLDWAGSCSIADTDYGVYEGTIGGDFTSHLPVGGLCTTAGLKTATFNSAAGSYYLVVPSNGVTEGSYGENDTLGERQQSSAPCVAQVLGSCP